jgi:16S rRNA (guanine527-N7)-methyltransferase
LLPWLETLRVIRPKLTTDLSADRAQALAIVAISGEALARLDRFVDLFLTWQNTVHLVAPSSVPKLWTRHVADSVQLVDLAPRARVWVDLGSGGGFPGLVIGCVLAEIPGARVHLVESNLKKAAFLREAARVAGAPVEVHAVRIEKFIAAAGIAHGGVDVVTARALAPLSSLLNQSHQLLRAGAVGIFPKGQDVEAELTEAARYWDMSASLIPSRTDPKGRIIHIRALERRVKAPE